MRYNGSHRGIARENGFSRSSLFNLEGNGTLPRFAQAGDPEAYALRVQLIRLGREGGMSMQQIGRALLNEDVLREIADLWEKVEELAATTGRKVSTEEIIRAARSAARQAKRGTT
jgi:hypothetical protein